MLKFRQAERTDCQLIWRWANESQVRAVSFSTAPIPWEDHVDWFEARLADPHCIFLIATNETGSSIGQVRFDLDRNTATISVSVAPEVRGQGIGPRLIRLAAQRVFRDYEVDMILAYIKPDNLASIQAFRKAGFSGGQVVQYNGQMAIEMRLSKGESDDSPSHSD
jgi:RimJ/RimL family protein N-acetyltransferase